MDNKTYSLLRSQAIGDLLYMHASASRLRIGGDIFTCFLGLIPDDLCLHRAEKCRGKKSSFRSQDFLKLTARRETGKRVSLKSKNKGKEKPHAMKQNGAFSIYTKYAKR